MSDEIKALVEQIQVQVQSAHSFADRPLYNSLETGFRHTPLTPKEREQRYQESCRFAAQDSQEALRLIGELRAALTAQADEIERLRKLARPQWFYYGDDCSSDQCRDSVHECIDEDFLWGNNAEGSHVLEISTATNLPTIWALVRFFTEDEKNARDSDDDYEVTEFASEDEARAALKAAQKVKA